MRKLIVGVIFCFFVSLILFQNCGSPLTGLEGSMVEDASQITHKMNNNELWITPPAGSTEEMLKFLDINQISTWQKEFDSIDVFKFYMVSLVEDNSAYIGQSGIIKLNKFIEYSKARGKKISFEVGAVYQQACDSGPFSNDGMPLFGLRGFDFESNVLSQITSKIDYLVLDDPLYRILDQQFSSCLAKFGNRMTLDYVSSQVVFYMQQMKAKRPEVQFILLVNFPNWNFKTYPSINGVGDRIHVPQGILNYDIALHNIVITAASANLTFSGFQIDNPYNFIIYQNGRPDSGRLTSQNELNPRWNRIKELKLLSESLGLKTGLIYNYEVESSEQDQSENFVNNTLNYVIETERLQIQFNQKIIQSWYAVPKKILPGSEKSTFMYLVLEFDKKIGIIVDAPLQVIATPTPVVVPPSISQPDANTVEKESLLSQKLQTHIIYRLFNPNSGDYLNSRSDSEGTPYWRLIGPAYELFSYQDDRRLPLYRCLMNRNQMHTVSLDASCEGNVTEGVLGFVSQNQTEQARKVLYLCQSKKNKPEQYLVTTQHRECTMMYRKTLGFVK